MVHILVHMLGVLKRVHPMWARWAQAQQAHSMEPSHPRHGSRGALGASAAASWLRKRRGGPAELQGVGCSSCIQTRALSTSPPPCSPLQDPLTAGTRRGRGHRRQRRRVGCASNRRHEHGVVGPRVALLTKRSSLALRLLAPRGPRGLHLHGRWAAAARRGGCLGPNRRWRGFVWAWAVAGGHLKPGAEGPTPPPRPARSDSRCWQCGCGLSAPRGCSSTWHAHAQGCRCKASRPGTPQVVGGVV